MKIKNRQAVSLSILYFAFINNKFVMINQCTASINRRLVLIAAKWKLYLSFLKTGTHRYSTILAINTINMRNSQGFESRMLQNKNPQKPFISGF